MLAMRLHFAAEKVNAFLCAHGLASLAGFESRGRLREPAVEM